MATNESRDIGKLILRVSNYDRAVLSDFTAELRLHLACCQFLHEAKKVLID